MNQKRLTINGIVALILILIFSILFYWSFNMPLRSEEVLIPRISIGIILAGAIIIFIRDLIRPEFIPDLDSRYTIPGIILVALALYTYISMVLNIGLIVSTFLNLAFWWIIIEYIDTKKNNLQNELKSRIIKKLILALLVTAAAYILFITIISMYMPNTILF
ncbi:tripartite tricarboxylate transporter TctB family protein [Halanaerobiaceae bacterium Z-7014]|uniref:Tripartite tricarboxylate transporter TctB family protein n=1 Tax=Halonatronomonas betaini TaxID=2778430 RepID=A0A931AU93_9FIRM|nr:tripartite tricarboxylate transporter TctB family protein [Halonatronomonas betaini]MBF8436276.1 tripartite tricarboxylate transporter TctB family protein [Halonatronomonas betaini]